MREEIRHFLFRTLWPVIWNLAENKGYAVFIDGGNGWRFSHVQNEDIKEEDRDSWSFARQIISRDSEWIPW